MSDTTITAGRKEWIGLAVLVLPCLLVSMDISVLFFAVPFISADLRPTGTEQLWIMDVYAFVLAGMLITMGALGDRVGRRRLLLIGGAAFGAASLLAAYSTSAEMLILTRALLGLAGATLMPSTLALIRNMFPDPAQRKTAIALWTAGMTSGAIVGPIVGGFLLEHFWWGSAFLVNVPAMVLLLVCGPLLLPEFRAPSAGAFDLMGAVLSLAAVIAVIYGIKQTAVDGAGVTPLAVLLAGLAAGALFVARQRRHPAPLVDLTLFRHRAFGGALAVNVMTLFGFVGITLFTSQYMQLVLGLTPFAAALWSISVFPGIAGAIALSGVMAARVRPAYVLGTGLLVTVAGLLVLTQLRTGSPLGMLLVGAALVAAGIVMASTLTADLILTAAPPERAGAASAMSETGSELGGALGLAILGSVGAAVYHHRMADVLAAAPLTGVSPEALRAAEDTLGGAAAVAAGLPGQAGAAMLRAGQEAFTQGLNLAAAAGAVLLAATAVATMIALRAVPRSARPAGQDAPAPPPVPLHGR
ncbi:MFS transporter [Sphaerisporangium sp. TRM90804]|uniref:MFS transporter n=1 Tax=Sphaerisporangium sp. TRM90804 TaxID=3031113 RepID=UPI00244C0600|nr:MFS transporter [Sphaerisporangium sp. TRM90804]MDH2426140.1 MFS transporter [Sphaerisporangium sp. TRM90804]